MALKVEVSVGELLDKVTILEIKSERITDPAKLVNVRRELESLRATWAASPDLTADSESVMRTFVGPKVESHCMTIHLQTCSTS